MDVKVELYADKMLISGNGRTLTLLPASPYSTERLLVGQFMPAVDCLKKGLAQIGAIGFFKGKPRLRLIAKEKTAGGLSEIELRCLQEVGVSAGAGQVDVSVG